MLRVAESPNAVLIQLVSDGPWIHISDSLRGGSAAAQGALFENTLPFLEKKELVCVTSGGRGALAYPFS